MFNMAVNNAFSYTVNAVSGTLRRSHPKSKFCVRRVNDDCFVFDDKQPRLRGNSREELVILQAMLTGENNVLIEYVLKADFEQQDGGGTP